MTSITIDTVICKKCGTCALCCPMAVFVKEGKDSVPEAVHEDFCINCGHCVAVCPQGALSRTDYPQGTINPINQKLIPDAEQVIELLRTRRSTRQFADKPVEKDLIEKIIDGARYAPSAHNVQSTEFVVVQDKAILNKIIELTALYLDRISEKASEQVSVDNKVSAGQHLLLSFQRVAKAHESGADWILHDAPVLLVFHAHKSGLMADINANLALQNASLVAHSMGLGSVYTGFITAACKQDSSISNLLSLPENHRIYSALALGYPRFKYNKWIQRRPPRITWL